MVSPLDFPKIYLLPTHLTETSFRELGSHIPTLTQNIKDADVILGRISSTKRAKFELRTRGLECDEVATEIHDSQPQSPQSTHKRDASQSETQSRSAKRHRIDPEKPATSIATPSFKSGAELNRETELLADEAEEPQSQTLLVEVPQTDLDPSNIIWEDSIRVLKLAWFTDSVTRRRLLPLDGYLLFRGIKKRVKLAPSASTKETVKEIRELKETLLRARKEADDRKKATYNRERRDIVHRERRDGHHRTRDHLPPSLIRHTTSENSAELPPLPPWLHSVYSCERPTLADCPNAAFVALLKKIRHSRILRGDEIGVRAYSSCMAVIAAYPYKVEYPSEIMRLPGCDQKIAALFQEWKDTGHIVAVDELDTDEQLKVLTLFWNIWGVGATTAREFYNKGWRELDDIIDFGWSDLQRVQQIGVKYYDEFLIPIPRNEVESIANIVLETACSLRPGYQMCIVGGYRKGKAECGDVDIVLTHPDESATSGFICPLVAALEETNYITHSLTLSLANTERGQTPVQHRSNSIRGTGFDTLDKALVVWQEPLRKGNDTRVEKEDKPMKNTNPHRRVDIIISPWKTAGCAVLGWSAGTTFERDLRRYSRKVRDWKFDSSGIRSLLDGAWIDVESPNFGSRDLNDERLRTIEGKEKLVFEALGLEYRAPSERLTG